MKNVCRVPDGWHSANNFFLKNKNTLPSACMVGTRQRNFFKKNKKIFAECLQGWHSTKWPSTGPAPWRSKIKNLCRVPVGLALGKEFFLKKIKNLCRVSAGLALGKEIFFKKVKNLCRVPYGLTLGKDFFLKKIKNLCRVPAGLALGKVTVNGTGTVTVAFLCRVSPGHSAKPLSSAR